MTNGKRTILLPGNPVAADLAPLTAALRAAGADVDVLNRTPGTTLESLISAVDDVLAAGPARVVAYSWGSWLALQHARSGQRKPTQVVLVNPYLAVERPVSGIAAAIAGAPVIGPALLARKAQKLSDDFMRHTFAPGSPPAGHGDQLRAALAGGDVWIGALADKLTMQRNPLPSLGKLPCPIVVIRGAEDQSAEWPSQERALGALLASTKVHTIAGAGHGLPWTHPDEVARLALEDK